VLILIDFSRSFVAITLRADIYAVSSTCLNLLVIALS
jgi:hypothetical protein